MIYVEQHILDPETYMPVASYTKMFSSKREFIQFYNLAKADDFVLINVLYYNPHENPGQKSEFDAKLYTTSRSVIT